MSAPNREKREALQHYFVEVIRDLVTRGAIKHAAGEPIDSIIIRESALILEEIQQDFAAVGFQVILGIGRGLELMAQKKVADLMSYFFSSRKH